MRTKMRLKTLLLSFVTLPVVCSSSQAASVDPSIMPHSAPANTTTPVALSAVFDESLVNSPRAASIRAALGISKAAYAQAYTLPNPSFFFLNDTAQLAHQIGASVPIEPPWKLAFRVLVARAQIKQVDLEIARNLWQLRSTIRRAYLDVVMANETAQTYVELHSLASTLEATAGKRFAADDVAALDVDRAELVVLQTEADVKQSERKAIQAKQRLSVLMGRDYKETIEVPRLPPFKLRAETHELLPNFAEEIPSLERLIKEALKTRLDLKVIEQNITANKSGLRLARANILPNPVINVGSSYSGNPPQPSIATRGYFIGITQELPVLNFQQGEQARLRAINIQLSRELESTKNQVTEEVVSTYQQLSAARERVQLYQDRILLASDKVANKARRGYEVGQSDITSTLAAQQANVQTKAAYLDAVRAYQQALTDLEQAIGHPL